MILKTSVRVCVDELQCIASACTIHIWGVWLCPDCQRYAADVHTRRYNSIAKSASASRQAPISMDAWVYLHKQAPCEQICLDVQILPLFPTLSNWRKDRIIHLPVESVLSLPSHGGDRCQWESSCVCTCLLAGVNPPHQHFVVSCEMKEMHMGGEHTFYFCSLNGPDYTPSLGMFNSGVERAVQGAVQPRFLQNSLFLA